MKRIFLCLTYLLFVLGVVDAQSNNENSRKLTSKKELNSTLSMGIQNIPDIYYDHYFSFPESIDVICSFIENHYDYKNDLEISLKTIQYLKAQKNKIKIIANKSMFFIYEGNKFSYNNKDICSIIATHSPETEYMRKRMEVLFFDSNNRNIQEVKGSEFIDSLRFKFTNYINEIIKTNDSIFVLSKNKRFAYDQYERMLLEYTISNGIDTYCQNESINNFNTKYLFELNKLCGDFCQKYKLNRILFVTLIIY